ncbi:MAG: hypothetical protein ACYTKD_06950 [Planctomycetota bacterium]
MRIARAAMGEDPGELMCLSTGSADLASYEALLSELREARALEMEDHFGVVLDCPGWLVRVRCPGGRENAFSICGGARPAHKEVFAAIEEFVERHARSARKVEPWSELTGRGDPADLRAKLTSANPDLKRLAMSHHAAHSRDIHRLEDVEPLLGHADRHVRAAAFVYIADHLEFFGRRAISVCLRCVDQPEIARCWKGGEALGAMAEYLGRHRVREAVRPLVSLRAIRPLAMIGDRRAVPALIEIARVADERTASTAATALADLGAREGLPAIEKLTESKVRWVAQQATVAAARLGSLAGVPRLIDLLGEWEEKERRALADAARAGLDAEIRRLRSEYGHIIDRFVKSLAAATGHFAGLTRRDWQTWWRANGHKDRDTLIREAVGSCRGKSGIELKLAVWALSLTESRIPLALFLRMNEHEDAGVRDYAQYGLGHIHDERAMRSLIRSALRGEETALLVLDAVSGRKMLEHFEEPETAVPKMREWSRWWEENREDFVPFRYHDIYGCGYWLLDELRRSGAADADQRE